MICDISIIIPTLGNLENLERLVRSIINQNIDRNNYEVLIVVNGPVAKKDKEKLHKWSLLLIENIKVYFISEKGVNFARNFGLSHAKFSIALFLDDDCELFNKHFLKEHIRLHNANQQVFATGGGYLLPIYSKFMDEIYNCLQMRWFISGIDDSQLSLRTQYLLGGNFSIKLQILKDKNLKFDEEILYGGSEYEFFKKANIARLEIFTNELDVIHHTQETIFTLSRKIFKQGRGKALIDGKYKTIKQSASYKKTAKNSGSFFVKMAEIYFNYVFWTGYYFYKKKYLIIFFHIAKDFVSFLNILRFNILSKVTHQIKEKKEKGGRF